MTRPRLRYDSAKNSAVADSATTPSTPGAGSTDRVDRQFKRLAWKLARDSRHIGPAVLMFCGAEASRHTAEVCFNVGRHLADRAGAATMCIDGDMQHRSLTERFSEMRRPGLADLLQGVATLDQCTAETGVSSIRLLPTGDRRHARNPLADHMVEKLFAELKRSHRYTLIAGGADLSPLLAFLARHSDGCYPLVRMGRSGREDSVGLVEYLGRAGARLLGSVATSVV